MRRISQHKDSNHDQIVGAYRDLGCAVVSLATVGNGCPDLLVKDPTCGRLALVEVKTAKGKLKPIQESFAQTWDTRIVRTVQDVYNHIRELRAA